MLNNRLTLPSVPRFPFSGRSVRYTLLLALAFLFSCRVSLIGAYDAVTDQSIQKIQTGVYAIIVRLERNISAGMPADNDYRNFKTRYEDIAADLEVLKIRCNALPKYDIIREQIALVSKNMANMEALHKTGISNTVLLVPLKSALELQFSSIIQLQNSLKKQKGK